MHLGNHQDLRLLKVAGLILASEVPLLLSSGLLMGRLEALLYFRSNSQQRLSPLRMMRKRKLPVLKVSHLRCAECTPVWPAHTPRRQRSYHCCAQRILRMFCRDGAELAASARTMIKMSCGAEWRSSNRRSFLLKLRTSWRACSLTVVSRRRFRSTCRRHRPTFWRLVV